MKCELCKQEKPYVRKQSVPMIISGGVYEIELCGDCRKRDDLKEAVNTFCESTQNNHVERIEFLRILPQQDIREHWALFKVGDKRIKVGITNSLRATWQIQATESIFFKQFGELIITRMLIEDNIKDCLLQTYDFAKENGGTMNLGEAEEYLKNKIIEAEDEKKRIGFNPNRN